MRFDHGAHFLKPATDHTGIGQYSQTYQYNAIGNITSTSRLGNYSYPSSGAISVRPHAVISTTSGYSYTYDANGNMLTRIELSGANWFTYTQQWDVENRLIAVTNTVTLSVTRFYYDGDGQRVKRVESKGGTTITTAYAGVIEVTISGTQRITQVYYLAGAQRVATRVITSTGSVVYFIQADNLGSASLTTDASGNKVGELRYMPYGETRYVWGSTPTDRRFTGQREESALGSLYDYGARFYSSYLNRWIQPDSIVPQAGNPQDLNRFSYSRNNPLKYTDPNGHFPVLPLIALAAVAILATGCSQQTGPQLQTMPQSTGPAPQAILQSTVRIEHRYQQGNNLTVESGLGTVVGSQTILTHNHWGNLLAQQNVREEFQLFDSANQQLGRAIPATNQSFNPIDPGTALLYSPNNLGLPAATLGDPNALKSGDQVWSPYWDNATQRAALQNYIVGAVGVMQNTGIPSIQMVSTSGASLQQGDSGGGVFNSAGQLVGNNWHRQPMSAAMLPRGIRARVR